MQTSSCWSSHWWVVFSFSWLGLNTTTTIMQHPGLKLPGFSLGENSGVRVLQVSRSNPSPPHISKRPHLWNVNLLLQFFCTNRGRMVAVGREIGPFPDSLPTSKQLTGPPTSHYLTHKPEHSPFWDSLQNIPWEDVSLLGSPNSGSSKVDLMLSSWTVFFHVMFFWKHKCENSTRVWVDVYTHTIYICIYILWNKFK